jgi:hypothetical protein
VVILIFLLSKVKIKDEDDRGRVEESAARLRGRGRDPQRDGQAGQRTDLSMVGINVYRLMKMYR